MFAAVPSPSPTPARPAVPGVDFGAVWHGLLHGFWATATASPWTLFAVGAFALFAAVRLVHAVAHPSTGRDPVRRFTRGDKAELLRRAGGRCEHHGWLTKRCQATERLEADHVHPHSRGGWTHVSNGQILCQRHNREKRATIPFNWQLRRLTDRRSAYYPPAHPGTVVRHAPRRPTR